MPSLLSDDQLNVALSEVPHWRYDASNKQIVRTAKRETFLNGIDLVRAVAEISEDHGHHPDIDIRWTSVTFALSTHSVGGLTAKDFELAKDIDALLD